MIKLRAENMWIQFEAGVERLDLLGLIRAYGHKPHHLFGHPGYLQQDRILELRHPWGAEQRSNWVEEQIGLQLISAGLLRDRK